MVRVSGVDTDISRDGPGSQTCDFPEFTIIDQQSGIVTRAARGHLPQRVPQSTSPKAGV